MSTPRQIRFIRWLLCLLLPPEYRQLVLDDLMEEWRRRSTEQGTTAADVWQRREVWQSIVPALRLRLARWRAPGVRRVSSRTRSHWDRAAGEVRHALRRLRRAPAFTSTAALTLAVGVGANVAIFSLIDGVLFRALPYHDADRLVALQHAAPGLGFPETGVSDGTYMHYREGNRVFEEMAIWQTASVNLTAETEPERVDLVLATPSLFPLLGIRPTLGPGFGPEANGGKAVLLSHGLWQRRYGSNPAIVGSTIEVNGVARLVAGVMPRDFRFPHPRVDLWMDLGLEDDLRLDAFYYQGAARLRDGVSIEQAGADLRRLVPGMVGRYPDATAETVTRAQLTPFLVPLKDHVVRDVRATLWLLFGAVGFVLIIVGANVANLHLVRASARERETVVRSALGAGRADLYHHFLAEGLLLAAVGGALGLLLGWIAVRALVTILPIDLPRVYEVSVDGRAVLFAAAISMLIGITLGTVQAARALRVRIGDGLRSAGRAFTASHNRQRTQRTLVAVQIAIALTLLVGSALMVQTFLRLRRADPGFDARDVLTLEVILPYRGYETYQKSAALQLELLDRMRALPGVESAGAIGGLPMAQSEFADRPSAVEVFGASESVTSAERQVAIRTVTHGYFETMRTPIIAGRAPLPTDRAAEGAPVLISANLAARLFPGRNALGQRLRRARNNRRADDDGWNTIIGVVADVHDAGLAAPPPEILYLPVLDAPVDPNYTAGFLAFAIRSEATAASLVPGIRAIVRELDPTLPIASVRTMQSILDAATARTRFITLLLLIAAVAALFLGVIGIYGVLSYAVGLRRREIGLRIALGARHDDVIKLVLGDGIRVTIIGLACGTLAAGALVHSMRGLLYGVSPNDPATFVAMAALLFVIALIACTLPALRAARVEPVEVLGDG
jgi:putative ABC transport system permease protein